MKFAEPCGLFVNASRFHAVNQGFVTKINVFALKNSGLAIKPGIKPCFSGCGHYITGKIIKAQF